MITLLACVGLHWIIKYGSILNAPRNILTKIKLFDELLKCSLCLGFWCGIIVYMFDKQHIILPLASAACCWFADNLNNTLQSVEIKVDKQIERDYNE